MWTSFAMNTWTEVAQMIPISWFIEPIFNTDWKGTQLHGRCKVGDFSRKLWRVIAWTILIYKILGGYNLKEYTCHST